jgi:uncharacterized protein (TIGR04255 family)
MVEGFEQFHFPRDLKLASAPLQEAWLEIRWKLQGLPGAGFASDPNFAFALGTFYSRVKDRYGHKKDLDASQAPQGMLPHIVRHQFWRAERTWPILQLGPGVASLNFTAPYNWDDFKQEALYLRNNLKDAYIETELVLESLALRYRNALDFDFQRNDFIDFLKTSLNVEVAMSENIPGTVATSHSPSSGSIRLTYDLRLPKGTGVILIATGTKKPPSGNGPETRVVLWQFEVISGGDDVPKLDDLEVYSQWLENAHSVIHEWFFSTIEGDLLDKFLKG